MGVSVDARLAAKVARYHAEGRACGGPVRSRLGCAARATRLVVTESWTHRIGSGVVRVRELPMCKRHADAAVDGVNFRVVRVESLAARRSDGCRAPVVRGR